MNRKDTLLVIDDEADLRSAIRDIFATQFEVLTAANGTEGLEIA